MRKKIWSEAVVPAIFVCYCLAYLAQVYGYPYESVVYPYILMASALIFLVFIFLRYVLSPALEESPSPSKELASGPARIQETLIRKLMSTWKTVYKPASVMIATFLYSDVVKLLGFTITTVIFLFILLRICGTRRISALIVLSLTFSLFLFFLMTFYLKIDLPPFALADLPLGF
jgi:hypothetical protein